MERAILQIEYNNKVYNKFILIGKEKKAEKIIYYTKTMIANKDVSINYYNNLLIEGDFDSMLEKTDLQKIIDNIKQYNVIKYIKNNFENLKNIIDK